jgi:hypothetical protein
MGDSTYLTNHQIVVPIIRYSEFLPDTRTIGNGVIVGQTGWETVLENNKVSYFQAFVQRSKFTTAFPTTMTPDQFVNALNANAGNALDSNERTMVINLFAGAGDSSDTTARAKAVRQVAEDQTLYDDEFSRAFVLIQYMGYLRRNPNEGQDTDYSGYDFWLTKLNAANGNYIKSQMVRSFIVSGEYLARF